MHDGERKRQTAEDPVHQRDDMDGGGGNGGSGGWVERREGPSTKLIVAETNDKLVAVAPPQDLIKPGDIVSINVRPEGVHIFDAESGKRFEPTPQRI